MVALLGYQLYEAKMELSSDFFLKSPRAAN